MLEGKELIDSLVNASNEYAVLSRIKSADIIFVSNDIFSHLAYRCADLDGINVKHPGPDSPRTYINFLGYIHIIKHPAVSSFYPIGTPDTLDTPDIDNLINMIEDGTFRLGNRYWKGEQLNRVSIGDKKYLLNNEDTRNLHAHLEELETRRIEKSGEI